MFLLLYPLKTGLLIEVPGGGQFALGPEDYLPVLRTAGEAQTFIHQAFANPQPASRRFNQQQPKLGCGVGLLDQKD